MRHRTLLRPKVILSILFFLVPVGLVACGAAATTEPTTAPTVAPTAAPTVAMEAPTAMPEPVGDTYPPAPVTPSGTLISVSSYAGFQDVDTNTSGDSATQTYFNEVFERPIDQAPDGSLAPGFATRWEVSEDQLTWTFTIREGMKFHNGDDVTAEDVAWTWNRALSPDSLGGFALEVGPLLSSEFTAVGNTVEVSTTEPQSVLPMNFSYALPTRSVVYPKGYFEEVGGWMGSRRNQ